MPALRERADDIPSLVWAFIDEFSQKMGKMIRAVPKKNMEMLQNYHWPGNIRQLRNVIEHAMIVSTGKTLHVELPETSTSPNSEVITLEEVETRHITEMLVIDKKLKYQPFCHSVFYPLYMIQTNLLFFLFLKHLLQCLIIWHDFGHTFYCDCRDLQNFRTCRIERRHPGRLVRLYWTHGSPAGMPGLQFGARPRKPRRHHLFRGMAIPP
jgi:hypothetical protein